MHRCIDDDDDIIIMIMMIIIIIIGGGGDFFSSHSSLTGSGVSGGSGENSASFLAGLSCAAAGSCARTGGMHLWVLYFSTEGAYHRRHLGHCSFGLAGFLLGLGLTKPPLPYST